MSSRGYAFSSSSITRSARRRGWFRAPAILAFLVLAHLTPTLRVQAATICHDYTYWKATKYTNNLGINQDTTNSTPFNYYPTIETKLQKLGYRKGATCTITNWRSCKTMYGDVVILYTAAGHGMHSGFVSKPGTIDNLLITTSDVRKGIQIPRNPQKLEFLARNLGPNKSGTYAGPEDLFFLEEPISFVLQKKRLRSTTEGGKLAEWGFIEAGKQIYVETDIPRFANFAVWSRTVSLKNLRFEKKGSAMAPRVVEPGGDIQFRLLADKVDKGSGKSGKSAQEDVTDEVVILFSSGQPATPVTTGPASPGGKAVPIPGKYTFGCKQAAQKIEVRASYTGDMLYTGPDAVTVVQVASPKLKITGVPKKGVKPGKTVQLKAGVTTKNKACTGQFSPVVWSSNAPNGSLKIDYSLLKEKTTKSVEVTAGVAGIKGVKDMVTIQIIRPELQVIPDPDPITLTLDQQATAKFSAWYAYADNTADPADTVTWTNAKGISGTNAAVFKPESVCGSWLVRARDPITDLEGETPVQVEPRPEVCSKMRAELANLSPTSKRSNIKAWLDKWKAQDQRDCHCVAEIPPWMAILGTGCSPTNWAGKWDTTYAKMKLDVSGKSVSGTYNNGKYKIKGRLSKDACTLTGSWSHPKDGRSGPLRFTLTGNSFSGVWTEGNRPLEKGSRWRGTRVAANPKK